VNRREVRDRRCVHDVNLGAVPDDGEGVAERPVVGHTERLAVVADRFGAAVLEDRQVRLAELGGVAFAVPDGPPDVAGLVLAGLVRDVRDQSVAVPARGGLVVEVDLYLRPERVVEPRRVHHDVGARLEPGVPQQHEQSRFADRVGPRRQRTPRLVAPVGDRYELWVVRPVLLGVDDLLGTGRRAGVQVGDLVPPAVVVACCDQVAAVAVPHEAPVHQRRDGVAPVGPRGAWRHTVPFVATPLLVAVADVARFALGDCPVRVDPVRRDPGRK